MNVLWVSDSPTTPSGFGNVTRYVSTGLAERGHSVSIVGRRIQGEPQSWQGCTLYPVAKSTFGTEVLLPYLRYLRPDVLITFSNLTDFSFITHPSIAGFLQTAGIPWVHYYPVDGDLGENLLPQQWITALKAVPLPVTMSLYGQRICALNGIEASYIPFGVDTEVYKPPTDKARAKEWIGYENRFVVLSDAGNRMRKMLPRTLQIFEKFARNKPDAVLHLHCDPDDPAAQHPQYCYSITADIAMLGLADKVGFSPGIRNGTEPGLDVVRTVYQAADVHLLSSWGEGFDLPTLQAASAGVVPMAGDYTAGAELTQGHGETLPVAGFIPDRYNVRRALVDGDAAVKRLDYYYGNPGLLAAGSAASRRFALDYSWENIIDQWDMLLRSRVQKLRAKVRLTTTATLITFENDSATTPENLLRELAKAEYPLSDGEPTAAPGGGDPTLDPSQQLSAEGSILTLPATPVSWSAAVPKRETGSILLTSDADAEVVNILTGVLPALRPWSLTPLNLGAGKIGSRPVRTLGIPFGTPRFQQQLARTVLIFDSAGSEEALRVDAAFLGVPCIGPATCEMQVRLWPQLSYHDVPPTAIARIARDLLFDQHRLEAVSAAARQAVELLMAPAAQ
jgi:glycosyltransferase involved in cell wall biosynthesis